MTNRAIFFDGTRSGYAPDQIERQTMSIRSLIDMLEVYAEDYGDDTLVMLSNDNGYTYGHISEYTCLGYAEWDKDGEIEWENDNPYDRW